MPTATSPYTKIEKLRARYYSLIAGKESLIKLISEAEISEQVYNSNAIENSTLSLEDTEKILLQIDLDRYINSRELFEAKNLARVTQYVENKAKEADLNREIILFLHKMLLANIGDDVAGRFRCPGEYVRVGSHLAPAPEMIEKMLLEALNEYQGSYGENIILRLSKLHLKFENIHPFVDGNGRIGRVLNNYLLIRDGFVPINIRFIDRQKYYAAFKEFDTFGNTKIMEEIVSKALGNSYFKRLAYLEHKQIIPLSKYAKTTKQSHSNLLNKANRQTIEAFLEKNIWQIGVYL